MLQHNESTSGVLKYRARRVDRVNGDVAVGGVSSEEVRDRGHATPRKAHIQRHPVHVVHVERVMGHEMSDGDIIGGPSCVFRVAFVVVLWPLWDAKRAGRSFGKEPIDRRRLDVDAQFGKIFDRQGTSKCLAERRDFVEGRRVAAIAGRGCVGCGEQAVVWLGGSDALQFEHVVGVRSHGYGAGLDAVLVDDTVQKSDACGIDAARQRQSLQRDLPKCMSSVTPFHVSRVDGSGSQNGEHFVRCFALRRNQKFDPVAFEIGGPFCNQRLHGGAFQRYATLFRPRVCIQGSAFLLTDVSVAACRRENL